MKTRKKNGSLARHRDNNRWKWMAAASAATAAGVTAPQASAITINLVNNYISAAGGNHLNADLTGDGQPDLTIANAFYSLKVRTTSGIPRPYYTHFHARVSLNSVLADAFRHNSAQPDYGIERLGSRATHFFVSGRYFYGTYQLTGSIPLFFRDLHINGGALTRGSLQVTVSTSIGAEIQLDSLTYNTPDQGSTLALLATGAGGLLALRRWRAAKSSKPQLPTQAL